MGREFTTEFKVRYDECGTGRQLRTSIYLGYTQEIATLDAIAAGWAGNPWVIRRTRLHIHRPVRHPATLQVKTWVRGFARSMAQRQYAFCDAAGDNIADAQSLWVNLDPVTLRPARIPAEAMNVWFPDGNVPSPLSLPLWSPSPDGEAYHTREMIGYGLLDGQQHLNNARYLDLLDDAGWQALISAGANRDLLTAGGFLAPDFYDIEYYLPATFNELLAIDTWLCNPTIEGFKRVQEIRRADQLIARSQSSWRYWDVRGDALPLPTELFNALA